MFLWLANCIKGSDASSHEVDQLLNGLAGRLASGFIEIESGKFIFVEDQRCAIGFDPCVQSQIDLLDRVGAELSWLCNIAVPAFEPIILDGMDLENVVPAISKEIFDKAIVRFKYNVARVIRLSIEMRFKFDEVG